MRPEHLARIRGDRSGLLVELRQNLRKEYDL
jgi:hypothetical protein